MAELKLRTRSVNYGRDFDALRHAKRLTYRSAIDLQHSPWGILAF